MTPLTALRRHPCYLSFNLSLVRTAGSRTSLSLSRVLSGSKSSIDGPNDSRTTSHGSNRTNIGAARAYLPSSASELYASPPNKTYHFFTPEDIHRCFAGKRIVMQGDSMIRQVYSRLINYLRLIPTHCEHVFSFTTSSYSVFRNGTGALCLSVDTHN